MLQLPSELPPAGRRARERSPVAILDTEAVTPTVASPTGVLRPGAGVSARLGVQVTNATGWNLLLNDSDVPPPAGAAGAQAAKYVLPPRCTATYPLGTPALAYRWTGALDTSGDLLTFVFSDDPVTAQVWPGVAPPSAIVSPVTRVTWGPSFPGAPASTIITTPSGLNVGQVHVYNSSPTAFILFNAALTVRQYIVRSYSWATIPLNVASGALGFLSSVPGVGWRANDFVTVAWSDINYTDTFPNGAGKVPSPYELDQLGQQHPGQRAGALDTTVNGTTNLLTIAVGDAFLVTTATITVQDASPCYSQGEIMVTDLQGLALGTSTIVRASCRNNSAGGQFSFDRASLGQPVIINNNTGGNIFLQHRGVGTVNQLVSSTWGGRYIS